MCLLFYFSNFFSTCYLCFNHCKSLYMLYLFFFFLISSVEGGKPWQVYFNLIKIAISGAQRSNAVICFQKNILSNHYLSKKVPFKSEDLGCHYTQIFHAIDEIISLIALSHCICLSDFMVRLCILWHGN